ncbi:sugar transferase [Paraflavitalea speifideaquila]|uniref:sugar transferase n=1 Tax=Paraflavitalea speifideaquila TaxID=3076558 RepID=UPI00331304A5
MPLYPKYFKRLIDAILSCLAFLLALPLFLLIMLMLAIANRGNPFFCQHRPGKQGRIFYCSSSGP